MSPGEQPSALGAPLRPIDYSIAPRVLEQWRRTLLRGQPLNDGRMRFQFRYKGSTCNNYGMIIYMTLFAEVRPTSQGLIVERAWIYVDPEEPNLGQLCEYQFSREEFLQVLERPPAFCGQRIEDALAGLGAENPAGCPCTVEMRNHKWRLFLTTLHYSLISSRDTEMRED